MNRRNFLSLAALAIAGKAAERVFPFRVYSIPRDIVVADPLDTYFLSTVTDSSACLTVEMLHAAEKQYKEIVVARLSAVKTVFLEPLLVRERICPVRW